MILDRLMYRLFPAMERRERIICRLINRKLATRAERDAVTGDLRKATTRLISKLCEDRSHYLTDDPTRERVLMPPDQRAATR